MVVTRHDKMERSKKRSRAAAANLEQPDVNDEIITVESSDDETMPKQSGRKACNRSPSTSVASTSSSGRKVSTDRKRKSPRKSIAAPKQEVDHDDPEIDEIVRTMEVIRDILGHHYVDVIDRLKLDWTPHCVEDKEYCLAHHHRKCPRPKVVDQLQSCLVRAYTKHNRTLHYLRSIHDMCIRSEFPGEDAIKKVIETILVSKQPEDSPYPTNYILQHCILVAEMIVMKFPPCWPDIKKVYRKVLSGGIDLRHFYRSHASTKSQGIFEFLLDLLLETISKPDSEQPPKNRTFDSESEEESEFFSFEQWLAKSSVEEKFWDLTREEKLDRLFAVLSIYTKILEYDLSIWLLRYPAKTTNLMFSDNGPLLATAFFDGNVMSATVKKFIEVFVICICLQFPKHVTNVMSRLMNLIAVGTECCEKQQLIDQVLYPNVGSNINQLAKKIFTTVQDKFSCKVNYFLTVIKSVKVPFVKYLLIDELLRRLNPDHEEMNVTKVYLLFKRKRWECSEGIRQIEELESNLKYPLIPTKIIQKKRKSNEIFNNEYIDVLLDCLRAYCEAHRIREVICRAFVRKPSSLPTTPIKSTPIKTNANKRYYMDKIEEDIQELEKKVNRKKRFVRHVIKELPFTGVYAGNSMFLRYREDVKYLGILLAHITPLYKNDPDLFRKFYQFLNKMLSA